METQPSPPAVVRQSYLYLFSLYEMDLVIFRLQHFNRLTRIYSTMAQAFSLALDSAFMLDNEVNDLTQSIELK